MEGRRTVMKTGYTTGACAAAAAYAAGCLLMKKIAPWEVTITNDMGIQLTLPIIEMQKEDALNDASAMVQKDAGSDIDVTHGAIVCASVRMQHSGGIIFEAGKGVGICTKDGLSIAKGEPAINPVPRKMIANALSEVGIVHAVVTISVEGGEAIAEQTYNPRLGVIGGISILGTTGIVRPKCQAALKRTIELSISVFNAQPQRIMFMVPGNIGAAAAKTHFGATDEQTVEVANHWGFALDALPAKQTGELHIVGHPGKLIKLTRDVWNTHSRFGTPVAPILAASAREMHVDVPATPNTAEEVLCALSQEKRVMLGLMWCRRITQAVNSRLARRKNAPRLRVGTSLVAMDGSLAGSEPASAREPGT